MGTKTISITDDAYDVLKTRKEDKESFSEVIVRLSGRKPLASFYGALSAESADRLESIMRRARDVHKNLHRKRIAK